MERSGAPAAAPAAGSEKRAERPIKVVRISNPMKFETSPSDFPALVQRLTGQGSDTADIMSKYQPAHDAGSSQISADEEEATAAAAAPAAAAGFSQIALTNEEEATPAAAAAAGAGGATSVCPLELLNGAFDSRSPESFPW